MTTIPKKPLLILLSLIVPVLLLSSGTLPVTAEKTLQGLFESCAVQNGRGPGGDPYPNDIPESECEALEEFYDATNGPDWYSSNWFVFGPCSWLGVTCEDVDSVRSVTELILPGNGLDGIIPSTIADLPNLKLLVLPTNQLGGNIPAEIGSLTSLVGLNLGGNQLSGPIPPEIGNATNLHAIVLEVNNLSGAIPRGIANLTLLEQLWLVHNQLSGSIPLELGSMINLQKLH